jgi:uncharacterized protein (TIGR03083 family)
MAATIDAWLGALEGSHENLTSEVAARTPEQWRGPSYATEWSVAQVLSHLGSGAEIFLLFIEAGLERGPAPSNDAFGPIWARWDSRSPEDQVTGALVADRALLDRIGGLSADQRDRWRLDLFGSEQGLAGLLRMRLGEHVVHTWDLAVMRDETARLPDAAADLLIDVVDQLVPRVGRPGEITLRVAVSTRGPARRFVLAAGGGSVELSPLVSQTGPDAGADAEPDAGTDPGATLDLPAEALIRLVYGRLDPGHAPGVVTSGVALGDLCALFPGF